MLAALLVLGSLAPAQVGALDKPKVHEPPTLLNPPKEVTAPPAVADCLRACPPPNDPAPFLRTPSLDTLTGCRESGRCPADAVSMKQDHLWRHTFFSAAIFRLPRFDLSGEAVEGDGVVIYEGMRLTVDTRTGIYDLSFTASTPPTPVTLRLQLAFHPPGQPDAVVRLTLPPVEIDPPPARSPTSLGATVRVSHRGFSELFLDADRQSDSSDLWGKPIVTPVVLRTVTKEWAVLRGGTARFGSGLPNSDDPGR